MEFPRFDGGDARMWKMNCDFYFEMYDVPEVYKTRMAVMNFSEELHEWYRCLTIGNHQLPWELLVEELMARFQSQHTKHPVDEFKRTHQIGKVEEFIKRFDRVRARLLIEKPALDEEFFVAGFISRLKEELKHTVELFNPRGLNQAFQCALKVEVTQESHNRKPKELNKSYKFQKYPTVKQRDEGDKEVIRENAVQKPWQQKPNQQPYTYEQRKESGLCHKCHGKYYPGHQCTGKVIGMETETANEKNSEEGEHEDIEHEEETVEVIEQAMLSMYAGCDKKKVSSMKFKGYIGKFLIYTLLDSGSTHSFVNPAVIKKLEIPVEQTKPMVVRVANGESMVTDTACRSLSFEFQGYKFEKSDYCLYKNMT